MGFDNPDALRAKSWELLVWCLSSMSGSWDLGEMCCVAVLC